MKKRDFRPILYLRNDTRYDHSYYGMRVGKRTKLSNGIVFNDLEWALLLDVEYLRNGRRYKHSYNGIL